MICPKCGTENKDTARFCKNCGQPLRQKMRPTRAPKKMSWLIGVLVLVMVCVVAGVVVYPHLKPEKAIPTLRPIETPTVAPATLIPAPTPEKVAPPKPPYELVRAGDFSIALAGVGREEDTAVLYFAITKVSDIDSGPQMLQVTLIDNHENEYSGKLEIDLEGASDVIINALPKGFAYVDVVEIGMPKVAPIERIKLGEREIAFKKVEFGKPQFLKEFGDLAITKGQSVQVGRWLSFTMEPIVPAPRHWELPITIENKEYSPLPARLEMAVQLSDGTISWGQSKSVSVPALSKASAILTLPIPSWVEGGPPQPQALLLAYTDESPEGEMTLRMCSISPSGLPPLVGQGPREIEDVFLEAYQRNGDREVMGDPLNIPYWFAGGNKPKDEHDVLIQEFPAVSEFGRSAIVWDEQGSASKAYVIHGAIWEEYMSLGGPHFGSKAQGVLLGAPTSDGIIVKASDSYFSTEGNYNTFEAGAIVSHDEQTIPIMGKIYEKWEEKELFAGPLGLPTSNESPALASGAEGFYTTGWVQGFQGGHVLYISTGKHAGKTFEIHGPIDELYMSVMQGSAGWLGFPVGDHYLSPTRYDGANFEGGWIGSGDGVQWEAFSYEPGKIAFVSDRDGNLEIYVMDISGENEMNLTQNPANEYSPAWSPDGTRIAFVSDRDGSPAIYVMNSDGSNVTRVCRTSSEGGQLSWFPNGVRIALNSGSGTRNVISVVDVDGKNLQHLARHTGFNAGGPTVSPDGERIAYMLGTVRGGTLRVMDIAGKALQESKFFFYGSPFNPCWSPDGKWIAFFDLPQVCCDDGIYLVDPSSGSVRQVTNAGCNPSWSADGTWIAFDLGKVGDLWIVRADGNTSRKVSEGGGNRWDPSWWGPRK